MARLTVAPWTASIDPGRHPAGAGAVLLTAFLALAAWTGLRRGPGTLAGGVAWSLAALLPTPLLLVRPDPLADRLLYLPMVGLALIAAAGAERAARGGGRALAIAGLCVVLPGLAASTWQRNRLFRSEITLWADAVSKNHSNARAHVNLGWAYERGGRLGPAEAEYREALERRPALSWAVHGLRRVTSSEGDRQP
ncbi:MAG: tetratricopeptide repeat protein [Thermoanaerobaculia bacterium]